MKIKFALTDEKVEALLDKFSPLRINRKIEQALEQAGVDLSGEAADRLKSKTKAATGRLAGSLKGKVSKDGKRPVLKVGSLAAPGKPPLPYAKLRDVGGTINGKEWLAIPIKDNLKEYGRNVVTRAGIVGISAGDINDSPKQYGFDSTFIVKGKSKSPLVVMGVPLGGNQDAVAIFALRRSVTQKGYGYLTETMKKEAIPTVSEYLGMAFDEDDQ